MRIAMANLISVVVQRTSTKEPWGFRLHGGCDCDKPLTVVDVDPTSYAAGHLSVGDQVLFLQSRDCKHVSLLEAEEILQDARRHVDMIVAKVDRPGTPISLPIIPAPIPAIKISEDTTVQNPSETEEPKDDSWWIQEPEEALVKPSVRKSNPDINGTCQLKSRCRSADLEEPLKYECAQTVSGNELDRSWWTPRSKTPTGGPQMREERGRSGRRALWRFHSTYEEINFDDGEYSRNLREEIKYPADTIPDGWTSLPRKFGSKVDNEAYNILHDSKRGWRVGRSPAISPVAAYRNKLNERCAMESKLNNLAGESPQRNYEQSNYNRTSNEKSGRCHKDLRDVVSQHSDHSHMMSPSPQNDRETVLIDLHTEIDPRYPWRRKRIPTDETSYYHDIKSIQTLPRVDRDRRTEKKRPPDPPIRVSSMYGMDQSQVVPPAPPRRYVHQRARATGSADHLHQWMPSDHDLVTARVVIVEPEEDRCSVDDNVSEKSDSLPAYLPETTYMRVSREIHERRQGSSGESNPGGGGGGPPPPSGFGPPPPPPPPGAGGVIPSMRIQSEIAEGRGRLGATAPGEPPAAIQNAMMTKDKKPFTYTPGGLDLSQIRSPRIQRRIERNAHDQGAAQAPPPPSAAPGPLPPAALAAAQPHLQVQVLPPVGGAPPPPPPPPPQGAPIGSGGNHTGAAGPSAGPPGGPPAHPAPHQIAQATVSAEAVSKAAASLRPTGIIRREQPPPTTPPTPPHPQPQFHPTPAPHHQPQHQPQLQPHYQPQPQPQYQPVQVQPERHDVTTNGRWRPQSEAGSLYVPPVSAAQTQRTSPTAQLGSLYIPQVATSPIETSPTTPPPPPQRQYAPASPQVQLQKAPTPWLSQMHQRQAQQQQQQQLQQQQQQAHSQPQARIIPIQIEGQESPKPKSPQTPPQWQHQAQPSWQQQQQPQPTSWQPQTPQTPPWQAQQSQPQWHSQQPASPAPQQGNTRVIPIQIEGASNGSPHPWRQSTHQPQTPTHSQDDGSGHSQWGVGPPVQSRSFRVLQKITSTDQGDGEGEPTEQGASYSRGPYPGQQAQRVPVQQEDASAQLRKLQLSEDDRALMNKFKAQVDDEVYLHSEADPRYRGAAIPSKAFRMLQNMTGADADQATPVVRPVNRLANRAGPAQQATQEVAPQPYIPPSEQTAPEPRKYTGGAIPSRSFRILQAMTAGSENCANGRQTPMSVQQQGYDVNGAGCESSVSPPHSAQSAPFSPAYHSAESPWGYYPPPQNAQQQQQMWDHYNAMCAYMNAAYGYPPPPPYPSGYPHYLYDPYSHWSHLYPSDSEELSGYSSTDEMAYYGANFARKAGRATPNMLHPSNAWRRPPVVHNAPRIMVTPTIPDPPKSTESKSPPSSEVTDTQTDGSDKKESETDSDSESESESDSDSSETDTEVEESDCLTSESRCLRSARSVPNISTYSGSDAMDSPTTETDEQSEDSYDGEDDVVIPNEQDLPHQLSVIMEESEISDVESVLRARRITTSEDGESSATAIDSESESEEEVGEDSTVMVSLPLKLKFSRSENDEEVTTVIVGDVRRTSLTDSDSPGTPQGRRSQAFDFSRSDPDDSDVSVTFTLPSRSHSLKSPLSDSAEEQTSVKGTSCAFNLATHLRHDADQNIPDSLRRSSIEMKSVDCPAEVSVCLPLRPTSKTAESASTCSEEEDSRARSNEESDCHWEDDSSSTSIQTVRGIAERTDVNELEPGEPQETQLADTAASQSEALEEFGWGEDGTIVRIEVDRSVPEEKEVAAVAESVADNSEDESCSDSSSSSSRSGSRNSSECCSNASKEDEPDQGDSLNANGEAVTSQMEEEEDNSDEFDDSEEDADAEDKPQEVEDMVRSIIATMKSKPLEHSNGDEPNAAQTQGACIVQVTVTEKNGTCKGESEEDDSGVTSDMSRHISEAENDDCSETSKKRKLSRYQRASTHSRLYKLLQEESIAMNAQNETPPEAETPTTDLLPEKNCTESIDCRKERLSLPLLSNVISDPDSLSSSSGITSPASPTVTDRLVTDLVHTLLQRKKGKKFRKLPMAKLHAAALRILQEDMDPYDTLSSTSEEGYNNLYLSPVKSTACVASPGDGAQPPHPYGSNYNDYCNYYNTWDGASADYDIMPSRAFKLLDQHSVSGATPGIIEGLWAKCPRVRSSKQVHHDLSVAVSSAEEAESPNPETQPPPASAGTVAMVREDH